MKNNKKLTLLEFLSLGRKYGKVSKRVKKNLHGRFSKTLTLSEFVNNI